MEKNKIADSIKRQREARGITQQGMADKISKGLGQSYSLRQYQRIEEGQFPKFKRSVIIEVDKILGTSFTEAIYDIMFHVK